MLGLAHMFLGAYYCQTTIADANIKLIFRFLTNGGDDSIDHVFSYLCLPRQGFQYIINLQNYRC